MNPFIALILGGVMGGVLASGGEPQKNTSGRDAYGVKDETLSQNNPGTERGD